jgi:hypothetical protein
VGRRREVFELAWKLGSLGREDTEAIEELRRAAGRLRPRQLLSDVADDLVSGPLINETDYWDRAYRLLRAAEGDGTVERVSPDRAEFFRQMQQLEENQDAAWERMTHAQPALQQVETDIRAAGAKRPDDRFEAINDMRAVLGDRLRPLIGPDAEGLTDPLLVTGGAYEMADHYLVHAYGLRDDEVYAGMHKIVGHSHMEFGLGKRPGRSKE